MNRHYLNIKYAAIMGAFLLLIAVGLSSNAFAKDQVTQAELDAAVAAQATVDAGQNTTINTQQSTIETLQNSVTSLNNANTAQQAALDKAQTDINALRALIQKYHPPKVGDHYGGGVVFYVDETGQHGLIASLSDLDDGSGIQWYNGVNKVTGATGDGIGAGASNTTIIVVAQISDNPNGNFAAKLAADFSVQEDGVTPCTGAVGEICYGDWYLPSKYELNLLYQQRDVVGGFTTDARDGFYWSSTEQSIEHAWLHYFYILDQPYGTKNNTFKVRAIRAF